MNSLWSAFYSPLVRSHNCRKHSPPRSIGKSMPWCLWRAPLIGRNGRTGLGTMGAALGPSDSLGLAAVPLLPQSWCWNTHLLLGVGRWLGWWTVLVTQTTSCWRTEGGESRWRCPWAAEWRALSQGAPLLGLLGLAEPVCHLGPHDLGGDSELASEVPPTGSQLPEPLTITQA